MTGIWWTSVSLGIFRWCLTATTAHLLMSLGQTLFHRYLGHRCIGGKFFENHLYVHHRNYSGDHVVSKYYLNEEANNTPFFYPNHLNHQPKLPVPAFRLVHRSTNCDVDLVLCAPLF